MPAERAFADANLFLRYLTNDVPEQADAVDHLLDRAEVGELVLVTTAMVVAEVAWTLESFYKLPKPGVRDKMLAILNTPGLEVERATLLRQAAAWYAEKNVDFIDAYNAAWMQDVERAPIYTFDRRHFKRFTHLEVRVPGREA